MFKVDVILINLIYYVVVLKYEFGEDVVLVCVVKGIDLMVC